MARLRISGKDADFFGTEGFCRSTDWLLYGLVQALLKGMIGQVFSETLLSRGPDFYV